MYGHITWILYQAELFVDKMVCDGIWVYLSCKVCLKYLRNPYRINKQVTSYICVLIVPSKKYINEKCLINFTIYLFSWVNFLWI